MSDVPLTEADFLASLQALLPHGRAWPRDPDAVLTQVLDGYALAYARVHSRQSALLDDAFPATTEELLPEWEETLGLPDPCAGVDALTSERRAQVIARLAYSGGQSIPYFVGFAAHLGFVIDITEYRAFRVGDHCGDLLYGDAWAHAWRVHAPTVSIQYFQAGDHAGEPLAWWGNEVLECEIRRIAPAHTVVLFSYDRMPAGGGAFLLADDGTILLDDAGNPLLADPLLVADPPPSPYLLAADGTILLDDAGNPLLADPS